MRYRRGLLPLICMALLSSTAWAEANDEAKNHFDNGKALLKLNDVYGATVEFEKAVALEPSRDGLFELAKCYKKLQRYDEAVQTYRRLLSEFQKKLGKDMSFSAARDMKKIHALTGEVSVEVNVSDAILTVDGREIARSPLGRALLIGAGEHVIKATRQGYKDGTQKVQVVPEKKSSVSLVLEPGLIVAAGTAAPEAEPPPVEQKPAPVAAAELNNDATTTAEKTVVKEKRAWLAPWGWATAGLTVAAGYTTVVCWILAGKRFDAYQKAGERYTAGEISKSDSSLTEPKKDTKMYVGLTVGMGVLTLALAAATTTLFILNYSDDNEQPEDRVAINPGGIAVTF